MVNTIKMGDDRNGGRGGKRAPLPAEIADIIVDRHLNGIQALGIDQHRGNRVFVPGADENQKGGAGDGGQADSWHQAENNVPFGRAVNLGRPSMA